MAATPAIASMAAASKQLPVSFEFTATADVMFPPEWYDPEMQFEMLAAGIKYPVYANDELAQALGVELPKTDYVYLPHFGQYSMRLAHQASGGNPLAREDRSRMCLVITQPIDGLSYMRAFHGVPVFMDGDENMPVGATHGRLPVGFRDSALRVQQAALSALTRLTDQRFEVLGAKLSPLSSNRANIVMYVRFEHQCPFERQFYEPLLPYEDTCMRRKPMFNNRQPQQRPQQRPQRVNTQCSSSFASDPTPAEAAAMAVGKKRLPSSSSSSSSVQPQQPYRGSQQQQQQQQQQGKVRIVPRPIISDDEQVICARFEVTFAHVDNGLFENAYNYVQHLVEERLGMHMRHIRLDRAGRKLQAVAQFEDGRVPDNFETRVEELRKYTKNPTFTPYLATNSLTFEYQYVDNM